MGRDGWAVSNSRIGRDVVGRDCVGPGPTGLMKARPPMSEHHINSTSSGYNKRVVFEILLIYLRTSVPVVVNTVTSSRYLWDNIMSAI